MLANLTRGYYPLKDRLLETVLTLVVAGLIVALNVAF